MRSDTHAAALRSAAKLVLGMASVASFTVACAASSSEEAGSNSQAVTSKGTDDCDAGATTGDDDDASSADSGTPVSACDATLKAAFPGQDQYQTTPVKQSEKVVACCDEELAAHDGMSAHRWECCVAYDKVDRDGNPETVSQSHGMACTPWGPPVPPRMNRARRTSPARRDMSLALATAFGGSRQLAVSEITLSALVA